MSFLAFLALFAVFLLKMLAFIFKILTVLIKSNKIKYSFKSLAYRLKSRFFCWLKFAAFFLSPCGGGSCLESIFMRVAIFGKIKENEGFYLIRNCWGFEVVIV